MKQEPGDTMDTTLATVTIISLLLAWAMAIVARQRIRAERRRSDARLANLMMELADDPAPGGGSMEPPPGSPEPVARGLAAFERRGATPACVSGTRKPPAMAGGPAPPRGRAPLAPRLPFAAPASTEWGGDGAARSPSTGGERARHRAGGPDPHRGLAARARARLRRAAPEQMPHAPAYWGRRAAAVAVATVLVASVSLTERIPRLRTGADLPVELLSLDHRRQGDYLTVSGSLHNPPGGRERSKLSVTAIVFDRTGAIVGTGQTPLPAAALPAGGEAAFTISLPYADRISRYRVSFMEDQSTLPHVDRRGPDEGTPAAAGARP